MNTDNLQRLSDALGVNNGFSMSCWNSSVEEVFWEFFGNQDSKRVSCIGGTAELIFGQVWMAGQPYEPLGLDEKQAQELFLVMPGRWIADFSLIKIETARTAIGFIMSHGRPRWRNIIKNTGEEILK